MNPSKRVRFSSSSSSATEEDNEAIENTSLQHHRLNLPSITTDDSQKAPQNVQNDQNQNHNHNQNVQNGDEGMIGTPLVKKSSLKKPQSIHPEVSESTFKLKGNSEFQDRVSKAFSSVDSVTHSSLEYPRDESPELFHKRQPDHVVHPEKWTKYNLDDVEIDPSTEKQSALDFLADLRKRKEAETGGINARSSGRPILVDEKDQAETGAYPKKNYKLSDYGTMRILEACEVGVWETKAKPRAVREFSTSSSSSSSSSTTSSPFGMGTRLQLSHLMPSDDSEDSDFGMDPISPEKRQKIDETKTAFRVPSSHKTRRLRKTTDLSANLSAEAEDASPRVESGEGEEEDMDSEVLTHLSETQLDDPEHGLDA